MQLSHTLSYACDKQEKWAFMTAATIEQYEWQSQSYIRRAALLHTGAGLLRVYLLINADPNEKTAPLP